MRVRSWDGWDAAVCGLLIAGLLLVRPATAATLEFAGQWPGYARGEASEIAVSGQHAFVAIGRGGLLIADIEDVSNPTLVSTWPTPEPVHHLVVDQGIAYLALRWQGLQMVDVRDPASPRRVGAHFAGVGLVNDVQVSGGLAYLARIETDDRLSSGLVILDVRQPDAMREIGRLPLSRFANLALGKGFAFASHYAAFNDPNLDIVDVRDPTAPNLAATYSATAGITRVVVHNEQALVGTTAGMEIVDMVDPYRPVRRAVLPGPACSSLTLINEDLVCLAEGEQGIEIVSIANVENPIRLGRYSDGSAWVGVAGNGREVVGVGPASGLRALDVSVPTAPRPRGSLRFSGFASDVQVAGALAFLCDGPGGLRIFDVSRSDRPRHLSTVSEIDARACRISNSVVVVAAGAHGLVVIDAQDPVRPRILGGAPLASPGAEALQVALGSHYAFLGTGEPVAAPTVWKEELVVFDLADPTRPRTVGAFPGSGVSRDLEISGRFLYAPHAIYDIRDAALPQVIRWPEGVTLEQQIVVAGRYGYGPTQGGWIQIVDLLNPGRPTGLGTTRPLIGGRRLAVSGTSGFMVGPDLGLHLLDFRDPLRPKARLAVASTAEAMQLTPSGPRLFAAVGAQGLQVYTFTPDPSDFSGFQISGPEAVPGGAFIGEPPWLSAHAVFSDGFKRDVTDLAFWEVLGSSVPATHFRGWQLRTGSSAEEGTARIRARYREQDVELVAERILRILPSPAFAAEFVTRAAGAHSREWAARVPAVPGQVYAWQVDGAPRGSGTGLSATFTEAGEHSVRLEVSTNGLAAFAAMEQRFAIENRAADEPPSLMPVAPHPGRLFDAFPEGSEGSDEEAALRFPSPERETGLLILIHDLCDSSEATWLRDLGWAVVAARESQHTTPPVIGLYDWREDAAVSRYPSLTADSRPGCDRGEWYFHAATRTHRMLALAQGQHLAALISGFRRSGQLSSNVPIHLIGHGVGGLIASECATVLASLESTPERIAQVTWLDAPHPPRRHLERFFTADDRKLDRYVTSSVGQFAPKIDGPLHDWMRRFATIYAVNGLGGPAWEVGLDTFPLPEIRESPQYLRREVRPLLLAEEDFKSAHVAAVEWYTATVTNGSTNGGFAESPWSSRAPRTPAAPTSADATPTLSSLMPSPLPSPIGFGNSQPTGGGWLLVETANAGFVFRGVGLPPGAASLSLRFRFIQAGDGDFLVVCWGSEAVLGFGLDNELSRAQGILLDLPLAAYGGQTNDLIVKLVSRGQPNAVVQVETPSVLASLDPDLDGIPTEQEIGGGTDPRSADSDGDGLSDGEERFVHHTDPRLVDTDGDGASDAMEVEVGTVASDASSALRLRLVPAAESGSYQLQWRGAARRRDRVRSSPSLPAGVIQTVAEGLGGRDEDLSVRVPAPSVSERFYWIESEPESAVRADAGLAAPGASRRPVLTSRTATWGSPPNRSIGDSPGAGFGVSVSRP